MPIKLPKGFSRRKSSGTALEEVENPPEPSFRVFERPSGGSKSFDGAIALKRMSQGRPLSSPSYRVDENLFDDERDITNPSHRLVGDCENGWGSALTYGRGSGGTNHSSSTGGLYDTSSSSARFSSTSTLPSSTDATPDEPLPAGSKMFHEIPVPPIPESQPAFSVRAAGRTFSFGRKAAQSSSPKSTTKFGTTHVELPGLKGAVRERATTTSSFASASTATPPKLLDADLNLGGLDSDGFGNMFESFGKRGSRALDEHGILTIPNTASPEAMTPPAPAVPPKSYFNEKSRFTPSPINIDRTQHVESSPYSWGSHNSRDGLMSSPSPPAATRLFDYDNSPPVPRHGNIRALTPSKTQPLWDTASPTSNARPERSSALGGTSLQGSSAYALRTTSMSPEHEDVKLVMNSEHPSQVPNRRSVGTGAGPRGLADKVRERNDKADQGILSASSSDGSLNTPSSSSGGSSFRDSVQVGNAVSVRHTPVALFDSEDPDVAGMSNSWRVESTETTPRARKLEPVRQQEPPLFNSSFSASARLAAEYEESEPQSPTKHSQRPKVMTPAQFERYRQEQEMTRTKSSTSKSDASQDGSDEDDDDDETERNRQAARQRRKQEAHLAVYRQQMMKVTGEQPSEMPMVGQDRLGFDRGSNSTPIMSSRMSTVNLGADKPADSGRPSDDEDEDVPLAILAAHGFPGKNRPPNRLTNANPNSNLRASSQSFPPAPGSVAGESTTGGARNSLPVFARNLPQDPYYGASLVNPSNREFLNKSGGSVYGGPQPNLPPGGLVGVIAGEERARAMRRGSPNAQGVYGPHRALEAGLPQMHAGMQRTMTMGNMSAMGQPGMPGMPGMPPMPMASPGDQAQFQVSQQMTQMMQMQMQWMQQMMQLQAMQPNGQQLPSQQPLAPQPPMNNNLLTHPGQMQRPMSVGSNVPQNLPGSPQINQRTMSMLDPGMSQWGQQPTRNSTLFPSMSGALGGHGYTPSIAPSERSNVGMPSRYRPVSIAPEPEGKKPSSRTSTFTSGTLHGWTEEGTSTVGPIKAKKAGGTGSDDDGDEGWEEMKKKREKKKSTWKLKKTTNGFQDMFYPGT